MKRFYSEKEVQQLLLYFFFRIILGVRRCQTQGSRKTKKTEEPRDHLTVTKPKHVF